MAPLPDYTRPILRCAVGISEEDNSSECRKLPISHDSSTACRADERRTNRNCEGVWFVAERKARVKAL